MGEKKNNIPASASGLLRVWCGASRTAGRPGRRRRRCGNLGVTKPSKPTLDRGETSAVVARLQTDGVADARPAGFERLEGAKVTKALCVGLFIGNRCGGGHAGTVGVEEGTAFFGAGRKLGEREERGCRWCSCNTLLVWVVWILWDVAMSMNQRRRTHCKELSRGVSIERVK